MLLFVAARKHHIASGKDRLQRVEDTINSHYAFVSCLLRKIDVGEARQLFQWASHNGCT